MRLPTTWRRSTTPLPLQRLLLLIAAVLLPIEIAMRRLRVSPRDVLEWLRHPRRIALALPRWSPDLPVQRPAWVPGAWAPPAERRRRRSVGPSQRAHPGQASVTPGLARDSSPEATGASDEDALGATLRWLAARRGDHADKH